MAKGQKPKPVGSIDLSVWREFAEIQTKTVEQQERMNLAAKELGISQEKVKDIAKGVLSEMDIQQKRYSSLNKLGKMFARTLKDSESSAQLMSSTFNRLVTRASISKITDEFEELEGAVKASEEELRNTSGAFDVLIDKFKSKLTLKVDDSDYNRRLDAIARKQAELSTIEGQLTTGRNERGEFVSKAELGQKRDIVNNQISTLEKEQAAANMQRRFDMFGRDVKQLLLVSVGIMGAVALVGQQLVKFLTGGMLRIVEIEDAAISIRKEFGFTSTHARRFLDYIDRSRERMMALGVASEDIAQNIIGFQSAMGETVALTGGELDIVNMLNAKFGVSAATLGSVFNVFSMIGDESRELDATALSTTQHLADKSGVSYTKVLEDVSTNAEGILTSFRGTDAQIIRASISARQLGLDIGKIASITESLLDFETSIGNEMKAELLLGRSLNIEGLRRAAFMGDAEDIAREIRNLTMDIGSIDQMNFFQKKALADATGMTVVELQKAFKLQTTLNSLTADQRAIAEGISDEQILGLKINSATLTSELARLRGLEDMQNSLDKMKNKFRSLVGTMFSALKGPMNMLFKRLENPEIWAKIEDRVENLGIVVGRFFDRVTDENFVAMVDRWLSAIGSFAKKFADTITAFAGAAGLDLPMLAMGAKTFVRGNRPGGGIDRDPNSEAYRPGRLGGVDSTMAANFLRLQAAVAARGGTIGVNNAFRTKAYNKSIGGVDGSLHTTGFAIDAAFLDERSRVLAHQLARQFELRFPLDGRGASGLNEPWHMETANDASFGPGGSKYVVQPNIRKITRLNNNDTVTAALNPSASSDPKLVDAVNNMSGLLEQLIRHPIQAVVDGKQASRAIGNIQRR